jgi:citrate synthase
LIGMKPEATMTAPIQGNGLENVVAATTRLSDVDGEQGRLVVAGYPVEDIAGRVAFEEAMFLLFRGALPTATERSWMREALGEAREAAFERIGELGDALARSRWPRPHASSGRSPSSQPRGLAGRRACSRTRDSGKLPTACG